LDDTSNLDGKFHVVSRCTIIILALSEVVSLAKSDGEIDGEEVDIITESISELRQETEALLTA